MKRGNSAKILRHDINTLAVMLLSLSPYLFFSTVGPPPAPTPMPPIVLEDFAVLELGGNHFGITYQHRSLLTKPTPSSAPEISSQPEDLHTNTTIVRNTICDAHDNTNGSKTDPTLGLPIALIKMPRTCTPHPTSRAVIFSCLGNLYKKFAEALCEVEVMTFHTQDVLDPHWQQVEEELLLIVVPGSLLNHL